MRSTTWITLLSLATLATASATEWLPGDAGDRQRYTRTVFQSNVTIPGVTSGDEVGVRVVARRGGWRLWSDFVGTGPRWLHSGDRERLYIYDGVNARLLADFAEGTGYENTLKTVDLSDGTRIEAWTRYDQTEISTRKGTFQCAELLLTIYDATTNVAERRSLYLAPEVGLVRWNDDKNPYDFGVFYAPVFVQHDLEPARLRLGRVALAGTRDAVRIGDRAFVARGARGLSLVDLRSGRVERTVAVPAERVFRNGDSVVVHGERNGATEVHSITDQGQADRLPFSFPVLPSREAGFWGVAAHTLYVRFTPGQLEVFNDQGASLATTAFTGDLPSGRFSWDRGTWGVHYLPLASGGVLSVDASEQPWANVASGPAAHDVAILNGAVFVAGSEGLFLQGYSSTASPTHTYTPILSEPVGQLRVAENRLWALTADSLVEVDMQGRVWRRSQLRGLPNLSTTRHGLLDVQRDRALILVAGRGLAVVGR